MGTVAAFVRELQSYEEFAFSTEELLQKTAAPESSVRKELARLSSDRQVINLRKGFYLIIPPRYQHYGKLPLELYVEKLFKFLKKPYYIGFYSAAAYLGAAHQRVQQDYMITVPPALRNITKGNIKIRFFNSQNWPDKNIIQKKSDAGYFKLSSPALTFADLIENQHQLGGLNRMLAILEELSESLEKKDVEDLLTWYHNKSVLQRMGFLLEEIELNNNLAQVIYGHLSKENFFSTLLSPHKGQKAGSTGNRWKIDANIVLESDL
ncbi:putative transcriptional regulator of viral defense system [Catalinimonas alkaloidigena]|uniref:type IV toxin-antitoxin system AbiEi family antitoxin domain-containing protein n=1 Tax=Catalinimonas TaxID=1522128 RepID=UPI002406D3F3|nr:type IV toxin-antitoxin system AbiEi family antitoxin [Catalinimonas alkaloidigena]MDF9799098.1 putative transcriptional regulator of viral defense system [Catalinimonas alkaloidigena]